MSARQFGQYPPARHLIAHISDTHFLGAPATSAEINGEGSALRGRALYGTVDTDAPVLKALERLRQLGEQVDALVFTGDIADVAEIDAYQRIRSMVEPAAEQLGAQLIWVMGNHDERAPFRSELLREETSVAAQAPIDRIDDVRGLRVITVDTTVPGYHHGSIEPSQREWLAEVLATPAPHGSILALHHPPIPTPIGVMGILELENQHALAEVVRGSDIRAILGGHLHYAGSSMFAGIPVSVAAATCYTMDLSAEGRQLLGVNGGQSLNLVHCYEDRIVHSVVPLADAQAVASYDVAFAERMYALTADQQREAFSRKAREGE